MKGGSSIYNIYRDGSHYDRLFAQSGVDVAFWINQAHRFGDPILELGCGTGKFSIPLAREGFSVAGLDHSRAMLQEAESKASSEGLAVDWQEGDMCSFELEKRYALILLLGNTLCHLLTLYDIEACFTCVKQHLKAGGRFAIDVFIPGQELLINRPGQRFPFAEYDDPDGGGRIVVTHTYTYELDTQIKRIKTYHRIPGIAEEQEGELVMRMYFPQELVALLKCNGFQLEHHYGSYAGERFGSALEKQILICTLTE